MVITGAANYYRKQGERGHFPRGEELADYLDRGAELAQQAVEASVPRRTRARNWLGHQTDEFRAGVQDGLRKMGF
jgi:hypothetical protein